MNHSKNIHSLGMGAVEDENPLEPCHPKYPERLQAGMFESRAPAHFGLCGKKGKGTMSSDEKLVADFRDWPPSHSNRLGRRDPVPLWGEQRNHSPRAGLLQPFIQPAAPLFPIAGPDSNRIAGVKAFESEHLQFVFGSLVLTGNSLDVCLNGNALGRLGLEASLPVRDGW